MSTGTFGQRPIWQKSLWLGAAYLAGVVLSRLISAHHSPYLSIWLPAGVYVACLLLADTRQWPALIGAALAADIGVDIARGNPWSISILLPLANSAQAAGGAYLFRRLVAQTTRLKSVREFLGLLGCTAALAVPLGATLGAAVVVANGIPVSYFGFWVRWWVGNTMAILLVAPFVLVWFSGLGSDVPVWRSPRRLAEAALIVAGLVATCWQVLVAGGGILAPERTLIVLFFLWSALRFGMPGVSAVSLITALLVTYLTSYHASGLTQEQIATGSYIPALQLFLAISALVGLVPAIVLAERDQIYHELGQSEARFRTLSGASYEGVIISENGRVLDANDRASQLTGYTRDEILGRPVADFVSPESRALVAGAIANDTEVSYEHRMIRKDGTAFDVEAQAKVMRFEGRKLRMTAIRDITERNRAAAALRESEDRYRSIIESSPESIFVHRDGVLVYANPSAARMHGAASTAELVGRRMLDLIHGDFHSLVLERRKNISESGVAGPMVEMRFLRLDGTPIEVEVQSVGIQYGGAPAVQVTAHDTTERKLAEAQRQKFDRDLQETQKLESLGVLAGGIAHDFNNILTGIMGNASMASIELPTTSPIQPNLAAIKEAARQAAELCKQMLAYSGKGRFVVQNLSLNRIVEETTHLLQISISKKAVLRFNLYPALPVIMADATQIRQVIMNLVINASEAIGERSGVISLNTGLTRVDHTYLGGTVLAPELAEGTYVYLEVSDSGCGMSPETQARIFDPFFTTKFAGRGLGLAAVLGIVRGHKGALKIYSELGRGTTFKLLFPCAEGVEEVIASDSTAQTLWRGNGTVLVVDDEETVRSAAGMMLQKFGFSVALAADGREAVAAFRNEPDRFKLVLMDLTMPHLDGEVAFAELRRIRGDVRVILMSGFNEQEAVSKFTGKGLASFLQKPFGFEELNQVLQAVLTDEPTPGAPS